MSWMNNIWKYAGYSIELDFARHFIRKNKIKRIFNGEHR